MTEMLDVKFELSTTHTYYEISSHIDQSRTLQHIRTLAGWV